jgi:hypothetical protein
VRARLKDWNQVALAKLVYGQSARCYVPAMQQPSRRRTGLVACCALATLLVGCISRIGPTASVPPDHLGPFPAHYEQIVRVWIEENFRGISRVDALSVSEPRAGFSDSLLRRKRYGWWTQAVFRSTDRIGMPKGTMSYSLLIRDGRVIDHQKLFF